MRSVNRPLYNVVDRARPHTADDLSVNHGGVAIFVDADIALLPIDIADQPTKFEIVCARARVGCFARVGLKSDGTTGHLAACGSASRYMARRKAT